MSKTLIDYIPENDYPRYEELLSKAREAKANAPKAPRKSHGPLTNEQKAKMAMARMAKIQAQIDAIMAAQDAE